MLQCFLLNFTQPCIFNIYRTERMEIFIESENKKKSIRFSGSVSQLLLQLKINPETVIVARNNELVTEDEKLADSDEVKLLSVISGG